MNKKINYYEKFFDKNDKINIDYIFNNFLYDKNFKVIFLQTINDFKEELIHIDNRNKIKIAKAENIKKISNKYIYPHIEQDIVKFHNWNDFICNTSNITIKCLIKKSGGLYFKYNEKNKNKKIKSDCKSFYMTDDKICKHFILYDFLSHFFHIYKFELHNAITNLTKRCFIQIKNNKIKKISFEQVKNILIEYMNKYKFNFNLSDKQLKNWNDFINELTERKLLYYSCNFGMISFSIYPKKLNKDLINNFNELDIDLFENSVILK